MIKRETLLRSKPQMEASNCLLLHVMKRRAGDPEAAVICPHCNKLWFVVMYEHSPWLSI